MRTLNIQGSDSIQKCSYYDDRDLNNTDLFKPYQRLKIRLAKQYVHKMYKKAHLPGPKVLITDMGWQTASIINYQYSPYKPGEPLYLLLSRSNIWNESMRSIKSDISHEVGHSFAPVIMMKHDLPVANRKLWLIYHISIFYQILMLIMSFFFIAELASSHEIALLISFLSLFGMTILSEFITNRYPSLIHSNSCYETEIIADEYGIKLSPDLQGRLNSFYECHADNCQVDYFLAKFERDMLALKNNTAKEKRSHQRSLRKELVNRIHDFDWNWNGTDDDHPSDRMRIDRLIWFWKTGMKQWR